MQGPTGGTRIAARSTAPMTEITSAASQRSNEQHVCVVAFLLAKPESAKEGQQKLLNSLDEIRRECDSAWERWVPHITLVPPFFRRGDRQHEMAQRLRYVTEMTPVHSIFLDDVGVFPLKRYSNVHLRPSPSGASASTLPSFVDLQHHLQETVADVLKQNPDISDGRQRSRTTRQPPGRDRGRPFAPHCSLGQAHTKEGLEAMVQRGRNLCQSAMASSEPGLHLSVDRVCLMSKPQDRSGAYDIVAELGLMKVVAT